MEGGVETELSAWIQLKGYSQGYRRELLQRSSAGVYNSS
jgi:hypothetical protein